MKELSQGKWSFFKEEYKIFYVFYDMIELCQYGDFQ